MGKYFNPRTHVECDLDVSLFISLSKSFQSTHSCRVRLFGVTSAPVDSYFNPRTHVECDAKKIKNLTLFPALKLISFHFLKRIQNQTLKLTIYHFSLVRVPL